MPRLHPHVAPPAGLPVAEARQGQGVEGDLPRQRHTVPLGPTGEPRRVRGPDAVRRALYLAALSAARSNPVMHAVRERLAARGKLVKVIQTAVARKPLVIANAVIRSGRPWEPELAMPR